MAIPNDGVVLRGVFRDARCDVLAYMIPYSITVASAAAPDASLSFLFWGAGLFVLPVIAIYTAAVYWIFRGKLPQRYAVENPLVNKQGRMN